VIDLHVHPLPGLDDGPRTMEEAVALVRAAADAGTSTLVATPHLDHRWNVDVNAIPAAVADLNVRLTAEAIDAVVLTGAEVAVPRLLDMPADRVDAVRLGRGPYLLVESPHTADLGIFDSIVGDRLDAGERVVLAHPERCPIFQQEPARLARLVDAGALSCVTAASMAGRFGRRVRDFTVLLFESGLVHAVASDAHDVARRPPGLLDGFQRLEHALPEIADLTDWLTREVPEAVLTGAPIPERPVEPHRRRSLLSRVRSRFTGRRAGADGS
jgi:protein-tyrosine phosphatase